MAAFDKVLTAPEWQKKRNETGLKSPLTSKVKMGESFKQFHAKKDGPSAAILMKNLRIYHDELKKKQKEKFFPTLNLLVEQQIREVESGIKELSKDDRSKMADTIRQPLIKAQKDGRKLLEEIKNKSFNRKMLKDRTDRVAPVVTEMETVTNQLHPNKPVPAAVQKKAIELPKQSATLFAAVRKELAADVKIAWPTPALLWKRAIFPRVTGELNRLIAKSGTVVLANTPDTLTTTMLKDIFAKFETEFPKIREEITDLAHTKRHLDATSKKIIAECAKVIEEEIQKVEKTQKHTRYFFNAPLDEPKGASGAKGSDKKDAPKPGEVSEQSLEQLDRIAKHLRSMSIVDFQGSKLTDTISGVVKSQTLQKTLQASIGGAAQIIKQLSEAPLTTDREVNAARRSLDDFRRRAKQAINAVPAQATTLKAALSTDFHDRLDKHWTRVLDTAEKSLTGS